MDLSRRNDPDDNHHEDIESKNKVFNHSNYPVYCHRNCGWTNLINENAISSVGFANVNVDIANVNAGSAIVINDIANVSVGFAIVNYESAIFNIGFAKIKISFDGFNIEMVVFNGENE